MLAEKGKRSHNSSWLLRGTRSLALYILKMDECLSYNVNLRGDLFTRIRFDAPNLVSVSLLLLFNLFVEGFVVFVSSIDSHIPTLLMHFFRLTKQYLWSTKLQLKRISFLRDSEEYAVCWVLQWFDLVVNPDWLAIQCSLLFLSPTSDQSFLSFQFVIEPVHLPRIRVSQWGHPESVDMFDEVWLFGHKSLNLKRGALWWCRSDQFNKILKWSEILIGRIDDFQVLEHSIGRDVLLCLVNPFHHFAENDVEVFNCNRVYAGTFVMFYSDVHMPCEPLTPFLRKWCLSFSIATSPCLNLCHVL